LGEEIRQRLLEVIVPHPYYCVIASGDTYLIVLKRQNLRIEVSKNMESMQPYQTIKDKMVTSIHIIRWPDENGAAQNCKDDLFIALERFGLYQNYLYPGEDIPQFLERLV